MHDVWHSGILLDMLRWFLVVPIVLLILFLTSSLALALGMGMETVSSSSHLAADYGPWERLVLRSVSEDIVADMKQDDAESSMDIALRLARYDEPSEEGGGFLPPEPEGSAVAAAGDPAPDATQTEPAFATSTSEVSSSASATPTASPPTPSVTSSLIPSATASKTPETPVGNAGLTPTPGSGPVYWFYGDASGFPMSYQMHTSQPQGSTSSSYIGIGFVSDPIASGMRLQSGTGALVVWARSPFTACDVQYTVKAGAYTVASGVLSVPQGGTGVYRYESISVSTYQFDMDLPVGVGLVHSCAGLELKWDGAYNDSRLELPPITDGAAPSSTPTKTTTATQHDGSATQTPSSTATSSPAASATPTPTRTAIPAASDTPTPGPSVGGSLWFYNSSSPLQFMMKASQPGGTKRSSMMAARFYSPEYSPGERLNAGTASVAIWAFSGFGPCDLPIVLIAGSTTVGAGTVHVDLDASGQYYTGSFPVLAHTFDANERLIVRVGPMCFGGEFVWDGNRNQSRLELP